MRTKQSMAVAATLTLLLSACGTTPPRTPPPVVLEPRPVPVPAAGAYLAEAASIDLYVVRASDLALERSTNGRVRALAVQLKAEHAGLAAQLSLAGRRLNLLPAAALLPRESERLRWLDLQQPFDVTFLRQMALTHEQSLTLHGNFARAGTSPTLRPVAANAERVEREHGRRLRS